jgi:phage-related protein
MPSRFTVAFFESQEGVCPVEDYMFAITNDDEFVRLVGLIQRLAHVGQALLDTNMADNIGGPIFELRKGRHRILYAENKASNGFLMLCAFFKQTEKTPREQIKRAQENWEEYLKFHRAKQFDVPLDNNLVNL